MNNASAMESAMGSVIAGAPSAPVGITQPQPQPKVAKVVKAKAKVVKPKAKVVKAKAKVVKPKAKVVKAKVKVVKPKAKVVKAKVKAKKKVYTVVATETVAPKVVGPDYFVDGQVVPIDIDKALVKKVIAETVQVTAPEGVATQDILPQYICYTRLYDIFNSIFFGRELPPVMLTFQEKRSVQGYYRFMRSPKGGIWSNGKDNLSEIGLNPQVHFDLFAKGEGKRAVSTLLHEMVHHWEYCQMSETEITKKTDNYHGKRFAQKMESLGLYTTNDGSISGQRIGRSVTHIVMCEEQKMEEGAFSRVYDLLPEELLWPWKGTAMGANGLPVPKPTVPKVHRSRNKVKYQCPMISVKTEKGDRACDTTVWSRPDREGQLACMAHGTPVLLESVNNPK